MEEAIVMPMVIVVLLILIVVFVGFGAICFQQQTLDNVKFLAADRAMLAGGITPSVKEEILDFAESNGLDPDGIQFGNTTMVDASSPRLLNEDVVVELSYSRNKMVDAVLNFFGSNDLSNFIKSKGAVKSQHLPN